MSGPVETVATFCAMWDQPGGFAASIREYFTEQTDYENVGMSHTIGTDQGLALVAGFENDMGIARIKVDMLAVAANGNTVLTERVDHMINAAGETFASLRLMGIFELQDGKIVKWRDYFDTAPFKQ
ncbi:limonene-1,2-epoxide hydrolase family protein [Novosphingobium jiangmenense]|uniref:Nuclear transport factor 2 family protein n=1 Tax=Novosphingobium jiangmenense TaxID=2791981 RepID=A0ABS0HCM2_9SPHN|nr:limonene-1,2-epoxide hydrolase family protein [Novosphingobium jiangmenense]MBF9150017.1 nuclear transport factor 2 family protein [Novosphingobium jiangmenense]